MAVLGVVVVALAAFVAFLLVKPVDAVGATAAPRPTASFAEASARFGEVAQREEARGNLLPACRS